MLFPIDTVTELSARAKATLRGIRNYLAGQALGFTRDEALLEEVLKLVFCHVEIARKKLTLEGAEDSIALSRLYRDVFSTIREHYSDIYPPNEELLLAPLHIAFVHNKLVPLQLASVSYDIVRDIYETFMGSGYRGQEGQFFTPHVAVQALVDMVDPRPDDLVIDPACGSGSFLMLAAMRMQNSSGQVPVDRIHGVDKDAYLVRLARIHLGLQYGQRFPIYCADSLAWYGEGFEGTSTEGNLGKYTVVLANPPFGARIIALNGSHKGEFELAYKWKLDKRTERYSRTEVLAKNAPPQVLFVEQFLSLLREGGRAGFVLPESVVSNPKYRHVVQYMLDRSQPLAIIGMPEELFKTSGKGGTHAKVVLIVLEKTKFNPSQPIFMAEARWCGHDSRGREIPRNDVPAIVEKYLHFRAGKSIKPDEYGFLIEGLKVRDYVLVPRFYRTAVLQPIRDTSSSHVLYRLGDLVTQNLLRIDTGDEVGKLAYGTGDIPFIRTSDISNWEIKVDPKHCVSEEIYARYAAKQDVREGDILMVRDGTYLVGACAYVTKYDVKIVYQSHLYKLRLSEEAPFDRYILLAALSSPMVQEQIRSFAFTQDIINTLGNRILDLVIPVPCNSDHQKMVSEMVKKSIDDRVEARELARQARLLVMQ